MVPSSSRLEGDTDDAAGFGGLHADARVLELVMGRQD